MSSDQSANAGDNSTIVQTTNGAVQIIQGLTTKDAIDLFDRLFKENFLTLQNEAANVAYERSSKLINSYLDKLQKEAPEKIATASDPDMQFVVYEAQKAYARSGQDSLEELLVNLLVDRSKLEKEELIKVVLNEALSTAVKVTKDQLDAITVVFLLAYTVRNNIGNHQQLSAYLKETFDPFIAGAAKSNASFQHIEYSGCGTNSIASRTLHQIFIGNYSGHFSKGFTIEQFRALGLETKYESVILITCLNDSTKFQENATNESNFREVLTKNSISGEAQERVITFIKQHHMSDVELKAKLIQLWPDCHKLISYWEKSGANALNLTSVGMALAIANIKSKTGHVYNLKTWLN